MTTQPTTPVPTDTDEVPVMQVLTANDRCDRCGAQAYVVTGHLAGDLRWCKHHYEDNETELLNFVVVDELAKLT
jgi:hypothetical protein